MSASPQTVEATLCAAYQEQAQRYGCALQLAEELRAGFPPGGTAEAKLPQMLAHLNAAAAIEVRIADTKRWWINSGQKPGPQLRILLDQVTQLIQRLTVCVNDAEQAAQAQKQGLVPELDTVGRSFQMQRAYGAGRNSGTA